MPNDILRLLDTRRSHRSYTAQQLSREQLDALLFAGISSPSANNLQPWHFTAVQNRELLDGINRVARMNALALPENVRGPRFNDPDFHVFYHAPTVIFISSNPQDNKGLDCGIAVMSIAIAAESLGLGSVILGLPQLAFQGAEKERLVKALGLPPGYEVNIAIAVGTARDSKEAPVRDRGKTNIIA